MVGKIVGGVLGISPESEWINQLKDLDEHQISKLFDGFCSDCSSLLKSRLMILTNEKSVAQKDVISVSHSHQHAKSIGSVYSKSSEKKATDVISNSSDGYQKLLSTTTSDSDSDSSSSDEEWQKFLRVKRNKSFVHYERIDGRRTNILQGLELHTGVFSNEEQKQIVESVFNFQKMGRKGQLMARTYSEPKKWMRGKGRVTLQFGCCYNYAVDKDGNPPGIIRDKEVDPLPPIFKQMIKRLVKWHVLPPTCVPNSCIVNIYDEGDCIPPHIDHHDFLRPFCTVSFVTESNILFGSSLKVAGPGDFLGPVSIPLPVGSVLVLKGNGANIAKHCVPAVAARRISVTFRRMDESKIPYKFLPDPELLNLKPLVRPSSANATALATQPQQPLKINGGIVAEVAQPRQQQQQPPKTNAISEKSNERTGGNRYVLENDEFPPLTGLKLGNR